VYVVPRKRFGYYDDNEVEFAAAMGKCIVYFGAPLSGPEFYFRRSDLRQPPFDGEYHATRIATYYPPSVAASPPAAPLESLSARSEEDFFRSDSSDEDEGYGNEQHSDRERILRGLPEYNLKHGKHIEGKPVRAKHRKACTQCGHQFAEYNDEWYFTDSICPWGADKYCEGCMASELHFPEY
jgi:hypothetical protein